MGFLSAFTLRLTFLLWFTTAFAFPARNSRSSIAIRQSDQSGIQSGIDTGSASDGAGSGFNIPAILWLAFGLLVGLYLTLGGMRLWRVTTALAIGLVLALCVWVAIVNVMNAQGLSDLVLALVTLGFFAIGSLGGLFRICRLAGLTALSILSGMSLGMRLVLMREGLLLRPISLNWIIIVVCAVGGCVITLLRQRIGIALSCSFTGTFLLSLGVDLAVNKQNGLSRGLRHLFDGNNTHALALGNIPYKPPISTQILLSVSVAVALAAGYLQFRFFGDYIEDPCRDRPFSQYFASTSPAHSADKLEMDTLRLPLQRPPPSHSYSRFSL